MTERDRELLSCLDAFAQRYQGIAPAAADSEFVKNDVWAQDHSDDLADLL
jgi:hypothetical protein